uniref:Uncharacterized protein TCIL3000_4_4200 n=1 Tax=Trypanosoma congolense (strain IL3000) TaxID=1068625 RepID=G0ULQ0_TRYCI|nr:unnamed protein product [Trypanosoma congolense IL3000]
MNTLETIILIIGCASLPVPSSCLLNALRDYSEDTAMSALYYAKSSYCASPLISNWTCEPCSNNTHFKVARCYENSTAGTLAFVGTDDRSIVVGFRGTISVRNWVEDISYWGTPFPYSDCAGCLVHGGFLGAYDSLRSSVRKTLRGLIEAHPGLPILITGHSLGGALALLTAVDAISNPPLPPSAIGGAVPHVRLYTFGKPRVGNPTFAHWVNVLFHSGRHEAYRIVHRRDVVPHLPLVFMGFLHSGHELWFNYSQPLKYVNCSDMQDAISPSVAVNEDHNCSFSVHRSSVADHLWYLGVTTRCSFNSTVESNFTSTISDEMLKLVDEEHMQVHYDEYSHNSHATDMAESLG